MAKGNKNGNPNISQHLAGVRAKERQEAHDTLAKAKAEEQKHKHRLKLKRIDHKTIVMATDIDYYTEQITRRSIRSDLNSPPHTSSTTLYGEKTD